MIFAIDFDGTLSQHEYPKIGDEIPGAFDVLSELLNAGHQLVLWTMRSGKELKEAVEWCRARGVDFWGENENPEQFEWTESPKAYAHIYIDDAALGCPLVYPPSDDRPFVDWPEVRKRLKKRGYLSKEASQ